MKNLKGIIGYGVGAIMAVLTLAWNAMAFMTVKVSGVPSTSISIYDVLGDSTMTGNAKTSMIMSIIALVLACVLAVGCVLGLLNELGVVKIKFMNYVNYALAGLFVVFALLAVIFMAMYCGDLNKPTSGVNPYHVGAGLIMVLISSVVSLAGILAATLHFGKKKAE